MENCRACGSNEIYYDDSKKCYVCQSCGARFALSGDDMPKVSGQASQGNSKATTSNIQNAQQNKQEKIDLGKQKQLKYFSAYKKLPTILMIVTIISFFITGVATACVIQGGAGFGVWLGFMAGGAIAGAIERWIMRVLFSPNILQVYYLQKLNDEEITAFDD